MRIIRLTEKQLREATNDVPFEYLSDDTTPQYSGNRNIEVANKIDSDEYGDPVTADKVANTLANIGYTRYTSSFGYGGGRLREAQGQDGQDNYPDQDKDNDGITNFYDNNANNTLDDNDPTNNTTVVPNTVLQRIDLLLNTAAQENLNIRQQYMVAAQILDKLNLENLPPALTKNLALHLKSKV